mgnify:CR=1 FL=1
MNTVSIATDIVSNSNGELNTLEVESVEIRKALPIVKRVIALIALVAALEIVLRVYFEVCSPTESTNHK